MGDELGDELGGLLGAYLSDYLGCHSIGNGKNGLNHRLNHRLKSIWKRYRYKTSIRPLIKEFMKLKAARIFSLPQKRASHGLTVMTQNKTS